MRIFLYCILTTAIISATLILGVSIQLILMALKSGYEISPIAIISISLGLIGYLGLLILIKGLHKTKHIIKITSLLLGLTGYAIFLFAVTPKNFFEWLSKNTPVNIIIGFYPIIISIIFLTLTFINLKKKRLLAAAI